MGSFFEKKKVLITGHTGFKGTWLTQILILLGADVTGIALAPGTEPAIYDVMKQKSKIREYILDIRDYQGMLKIFNDEKPEIVFHLAAQPIVTESYSNPRYTYDVNVMGTVNLCECIRSVDCVKSFVNITTDKVYRNNEWEFPYRENDFLDGYDPYSNSKSCSELVTASYKRAFFNEMDISVSTCRAGNVIGGGDFSKNRIIPDCYRNVVSGKSIEIRNPHSIRPYQHVLEALVFYLLVAKAQMLDRRFSGEYNIGPEYKDCITTGQIADLFCRAWGENTSWKSIFYNGPHEANILRLDTSKAKTIFGWNPVWGIERAVAETVAWYKIFFSGGDMESFTNEQIRRYLQETSEWWDEKLVFT